MEGKHKAEIGFAVVVFAYILRFTFYSDRVFRAGKDIRGRMLIQHKYFARSQVLDLRQTFAVFSDS